MDQQTMSAANQLAEYARGIRRYKNAREISIQLEHETSTSNAGVVFKAATTVVARVNSPEYSDAADKVRQFFKNDAAGITDTAEEYFGKYKSYVREVAYLTIDNVVCAAAICGNDVPIVKADRMALFVISKRKLTKEAALGARLLIDLCRYAYMQQYEGVSLHAAEWWLVWYYSKFGFQVTDDQCGPEEPNEAFYDKALDQYYQESTAKTNKERVVHRMKELFHSVKKDTMFTGNVGTKTLARKATPKLPEITGNGIHMDLCFNSEKGKVIVGL